MTVHQRLLQELGMSKQQGVLDYSLLGAVLSLLAIGLVMVSSASMEVSGTIYANPFYILTKQVIFVLTGLACLLFMLMLPVATVEKHSWLALFTGIGLLVLVLLVGREINGSVRWIPLGFFNLQASEAAKVLIIVYLAAYLVRRLEEVRTQWSGFFKPMAILSVSALLLLMEPDFGALVVLMGASVGMIFMAGARLGQFLIVIAILVAFVVGLVVFEPYRMARLTSYMDPWANAYGSGYQLTQALIAFGRGEWFGEGLGHSIQKLFYLPEAHTDFVYAVLAEELGVFGAVLVLFLFLFVAWRAMQIGQRCERAGLLFHGYVSYGFGLLFGSQAMINIAVNTGLLPTKGLALPLISYGGSSLLVNCLTFGMLLRIDYERRLKQTENRKQDKEKEVLRR